MWGRAKLQKTIEKINDLLIYAFNSILTFEKEVLRQSQYNDLTVTEMHVIEAVGREPKRMTEVANKLGITVGSLTTGVNRIVKKGYIERMYNKEDRRCVYIILTEKGELVYDLHEQFHEQMAKEMIVQLEVIDCQILIGSLERLANFFKV